MGRPVTINGRELTINDAPFIEANAEYSVTVDDDGTVMVERTDLKAENAKLREDNDRLIEAIEELHSVSLEDRLVQLENDNAELRELVRALDWCTENADVRDKCDRCPLEQSDACEPECEVMMREMGVESKE